MTRQLPTAYLNGRMLPLDQAHISPLDRGFLFGEGVYEVIAAYAGVPFHLAAHLERLRRSCELLGFAVPDTDALGGALAELVRANGGGDQAIYLQITRGAGDAPRHHLVPAASSPTVFAMCQTLPPRDAAIARDGVAAITAADERWARCEIKSTSLLANVLARQAAHERGAVEAILIRDGEVTEGSTSSVFAVHGGGVTLPPPHAAILPGTTAELVLALLARAGVSVRRAPIALDALRGADEIWLSSTTRGVLPVCRLDGEPVGAGAPGPLWRRLDALYVEAVEAAQ